MSSITSHGYVIVWVGFDHHLSDVRGYAYEHRVVAEKAIGRRLRPGELVHHKNGDKADNRPENLEVFASDAEHLLHHRSPESQLRLPGEANSTIECACGCGQEFTRYDDLGRPRRWAPGHHARSLTPEDVADARRRVRAGESVASVARDLPVKYGSVCNAIYGRTWASVTDPPPLRRPA